MHDSPLVPAIPLSAVPVRALRTRVVATGVALLLMGTGLGLACSEIEAPGESDVAVRVEHVGFDANHLPVVVLEERDGERWLPIWIGSAEAHSIATEIAEHRAPRPNSHDLARRVIQGLSAELERVVVTELRSGTYYAVITLRRAGSRVEIDSRPSDAIAIALRSGAPIFVRAHLFEESSTPVVDDESANAPSI